jgi:hypothetical protein
MMATTKLFAPGATDQYWVLPPTNALSPNAQLRHSQIMHRAISADKSPFCTQTILLLSNGYTRIVVMIVVCLTIALSFMNVILVTFDLTSNALTSFQLFLMIPPILKQFQFTCEACGKEIKNIAYLCSICKLLVYKRCTKIPRTVKIKLHNHFLNLIYSIHEIKKCDGMFCRICFEKVNTKYAAYHCQGCRYVIHLDCVKRFWDMYRDLPTTSELMLKKFVGHATHLIKVLFQANDKNPNSRKIQHFSHQQHKLILYDDEIKDDKLC